MSDSTFLTYLFIT